MDCLFVFSGRMGWLLSHSCIPAPYTEELLCGRTKIAVQITLSLWAHHDKCWRDVCRKAKLSQLFKTHSLKILACRLDAAYRAKSVLNSTAVLELGLKNKCLLPHQKQAVLIIWQINLVKVEIYILFIFLNRSALKIKDITLTLIVFGYL